MSHSPFATLFLELQKQIQAHVREIRFIEQEFGQLEMEHPPVTFPCVLIDFPEWRYEDAGENLQFAQGNVRIRLAFETFSQTSSITPATAKSQGLKFYDIEWQLYQCLQGWKPEQYGYLSRTAVATEQRDDNLRVRIMEFGCSYQDCSAMPIYRKVKMPPLNIETTILNGDNLSGAPE